MNTSTDLREAVKNITEKITQEYPELSEYVIELPDKKTTHGKRAANDRILTSYYHSLVEMLTEFQKNPCFKK
jgi:hypothetical protein